ncbi:MAG: hypothetical protein AAF719_02330 [Pseudomonadota bacterium]
MGKLQYGVASAALLLASNAAHAQTVDTASDENELRGDEVVVVGQKFEQSL